MSQEFEAVRAEMSNFNERLSSVEASVDALRTLIATLLPDDPPALPEPPR